MSVLSDGDILKLIVSGEMRITPFVECHVQPSSIDLTLDTHISIPLPNQTINPDEDCSNAFEDLEIGNDGYILLPKKMIIARIAEYITMPEDCNGHIYNRNSLVRVGLNVSLSGYINPGYKGQLPIVMYNIGESEIKLFHGMRICQLELNRTEAKPIRDYSKRNDAKYFGEQESLLSSLHKDLEFLDFHATGKSNENLSDFLQKRIQEKSSEFINNLSDREKEKLGLL